MKSKNLTEKGKICNCCGVEKSLTEFTKVCKTRDWLRAECKKCRNEKDKQYTRKRYAKDKQYREKMKIRAKAYRDGTFEQKPKLPIIDMAVKIMAAQIGYDPLVLNSIVENLFKKQKGQCAICGIHQDSLNKRLCIDHCHKTNRIRGLLCTSCNAGIGNLRESIELLKNSIDYLRNFR